MEPHDLERIRRSVAMLPPGHSAGALTLEAALDLVYEIATLQAETSRYRHVVAQLRTLLASLED